jgi:ORF6N domain
MPEPTPISPESIEQQIWLIRGQKVILDYDLAALYSVATHRFNEAVKRNAGRFPVDFCFQLTHEEVAQVREAAATRNTDNNEEQSVNYNSSQIAMSSRRHRGGAYLPWGFH